MWTHPAPTGNRLQDMVDVATRNLRFIKAEATADELRDLAKLLRALDKEIFQGGQNTPFVSAEAERIRQPILCGWYNPLPGLGRREHKQQRLFDKVGGLLGEITSGTAGSPRERLASLAADVDELVATIDPQPATIETVDDSASVAAETLREPPGPDANKWPPDAGWCFHEGEAAFRRVAFPIQGVPWRLLKKLAEKTGTPVSEATLVDAMNGDDGNAGEGSLRSQLTRTRDILRAAFGMSSDLDPLPNVERGRDAAWKLDEKVFPSVSEIQRSLNGR